jgi:hypothetical protein
MRWVTDRTGRFARRPYYTKDELDAVCEARVRRFLLEHNGVVAYPLSTADLTVLIEQETDDLDQYADLSRLGGDGVEVEGITEFFPNQRPRVRIARGLSESPGREARLRTTLSHEFGHVLFHDFAGRWGTMGQMPLFGETTVPPCVHHAMLGTGKVDWMEWQAGYASGAILMPRTEVCETARPLVEEAGGPIYVENNDARRLIRWVRKKFLVSDAAARVRLLQLGHLVDTRTPRIAAPTGTQDNTPCGEGDNALICQLAMW